MAASLGVRTCRSCNEWRPGHYPQWLATLGSLMRNQNSYNIVRLEAASDWNPRSSWYNLPALPLHFADRGVVTTWMLLRGLTTPASTLFNSPKLWSSSSHESSNGFLSLSISTAKNFIWIWNAPRLHRLLHRSISRRLLRIKNSAIDRQLDIVMGVTILLEEEEGGGGGREELVVQHDWSEEVSAKTKSCSSRTEWEEKERKRNMTWLCNAMM